MLSVHFVSTSLKHSLEILLKNENNKYILGLRQ